MSVRQRLFVILLWASGLAALAVFAYSGRDFYWLSLLREDARFDLDSFDALRASGSTGHLLGFVGGALILANLAYLLRRHVSALRRAGSLRVWMSLHAVTGLAAFGYITLHAGFGAGNVLHLTAAIALGVLVATGVLGRVVYALVPHDRGGAELSPADFVVRLIQEGIEDEDELVRRVRRKERLRHLLSLWRDVHRPMAMLMVGAAAAHIATVLLSRTAWIAQDPMGVHVWVLSVTAGVLLLLLVSEVFLVRRRRRRARRDVRTLVRSELAGLNIPPSLNPVVDLGRCMGSAACVAVCPEQTVLGILDGQAHVVRGSNCVGHGRCAAHCPMGAISLVFGSARRGVDIPHVSKHFETNVPGLYITGELGGMGLIQNAARQSLQAVAHIAETRPRGEGEVLDLLVVGAGPAGMAASLAAHEAGLRFVTLEQEQAGGAIQHYPRQKVVMTEPFQLPGARPQTARLLTKEELLALWQEALRTNRVAIHEGEKVTGVAQEEGGFRVTTPAGDHRAATVLMAVGRRGSPRKLGVPGEELPKVTYRLIEPDQYAGRHLLVVGGGDSAVENALALAEAGAASVALSYRKATISRAREANRDRFRRAVDAGSVRFVPESTVVRIGPEDVQLDTPSGRDRFVNDFVVIQAGGVLPLDLLKRVGVRVERKFGAGPESCERVPIRRETG